MPAPKYIKPERVWLKTHPEPNEKWLQDRIGDDPSLLGLGDLVLRDRERPRVSVLNVRVSLAGSADGSLRMTHTVSERLPMSIPAQLAYTTSIVVTRLCDQPLVDQPAPSRRTCRGRVA